MATSIQDKIRKLLALSASPNDNEAATALKLAQKLMMEHGVEESELHPEVTHEVSETGFHEVKHKFQVYAAQAAGILYGCKVINYKNISSITFVGRRDNRQAAELTWSFLLLQIEQWYKNELPKGMTQKQRSSYRKEYKLSMAATLYSRCKDYTPASSSTALVLHKDQLLGEIEDYFKDQNVVTRKSKARRINNTEAFLKGAAAGQSADIHKGVN